jgi:hypothetical protein
LKGLRIAVVSVALAALSPHVQAATCSEEIDLLARQYALATDRPRAEPPSGAVERPATGSAELSAAKRNEMQGLLDAARAANAQGEEAKCFERLSEARAIPEPG